MSEAGGGNRRVSFDPGDQTTSPNIKPLHTQKYNRKRIQRVLDLEEWIDEQMRLLYDCKEDSDLPVDLYLDDIIGNDEDQYESFIRSKLTRSKLSTEKFVTELLARIKELPKTK
ncbi:protein phosphatase 1 regulatory subunit 14C-like isoform X2 [Oscarella lobularis]|uniref:protein phosphatase 1 regulatory subunit 14C-like isoform X2 n=1 Tax=Oscarella lobularis TaxID=121494 RepID=UPI00331345B6